MTLTEEFVTTKLDSKEIEARIRNEIAEIKGIGVNSVDCSAPVLRYGLESIQLASIIANIEDEFGIVIPAIKLSQELSISEIAGIACGLSNDKEEVQSDFFSKMNTVINDDWARKLNELNVRVNEARTTDSYLYQAPIMNTSPGLVAGNSNEMIMLASYSYLGLAWRSDIANAAAEAAKKYGTGVHGVPMLAGTLPLHLDLEDKISKFKKTESASIFSSGYATNLSVLSSLTSKGDLLIMDQLVHASIADGAALSTAESVFFKHNDVNDLIACLENSGNRRALVVVDAVYSMEGDIAPLPQISEVCKAYGALLMVDEAHSLGVIGTTGAGIEEYFGLTNAIDIKMGTLSKTIPSVGGYVAASEEIISAIKHNAHPFVFSSALPASCTAAAITAFDILEQEPELSLKLRENTKHFISLLNEYGLHQPDHGTPIIPIVCRDEESTYRFAAMCRNSGLFVVPVTYPAVPISAPRLRVTVTASHTAEMIETAAKILVDCSKASGAFKN